MHSNDGDQKASVRQPLLDGCLKMLLNCSHGLLGTAIAACNHAALEASQQPAAPTTMQTATAANSAVHGLLPCLGLVGCAYPVLACQFAARVDVSACTRGVGTEQVTLVQHASGQGRRTQQLSKRAAAYASKHKPMAAAAALDEAARNSLRKIQMCLKETVWGSTASWTSGQLTGATQDMEQPTSQPPQEQQDKAGHYDTVTVHGDNTGCASWAAAQVLQAMPHAQAALQCCRAACRALQQHGHWLYISGAAAC